MNQTAKEESLNASGMGGGPIPCEKDKMIYLDWKL
jgi:hypothetical protein